MAETIISLCVLAIENDQSFITQQPVQAGAAIIGPTPKGKVGIPVLCTTYSDYLNKFGSTFLSGSQTYTYFTSIAAYNYFNSGGNTLLVTRVVSGSTSLDWTPATSSFISSFKNWITSAEWIFTFESFTSGPICSMRGSLPQISFKFSSQASVFSFIFCFSLYSLSFNKKSKTSQFKIFQP